eukprot:3721620-Rhodomonas_salina.1
METLAQAFFGDEIFAYLNDNENGYFPVDPTSNPFGFGEQFDAFNWNYDKKSGAAFEDELVLVSSLCHLSCVSVAALHSCESTGS